MFLTIVTKKYCLFWNAIFFRSNQAEDYMDQEDLGSAVQAGKTLKTNAAFSGKQFHSILYYDICVCLANPGSNFLLCVLVTGSNRRGPTGIFYYYCLLLLVSY